jgi:hypothetical protein
MARDVAFALDTATAVSPSRPLPASPRAPTSPLPHPAPTAARDNGEITGAFRLPSDLEKNPYEEVTVFYATDRTPAGRPFYYGPGRSDLHYGRCLVTVPTKRKVGDIPRPGFILRTLRLELKSKHVTIQSRREMARWVAVASTQSTKNTKRVGAAPKVERLSAARRTPATAVVPIPIT